MSVTVGAVSWVLLAMAAAAIVTRGSRVSIGDSRVTSVDNPAKSGRKKNWILPRSAACA